jgi:hypothetical protein
MTPRTYPVPVPPIKRVPVPEPRVASTEIFLRMLGVHIMQSDPYNKPFGKQS